MKELGNGLAQLVAIIMIMITLAISTAAFSQWASSDTSASNDGSNNIRQSETGTPSMSASAAP